MFRDSRGVVHTVSSADPLTDVPAHAALALARALLVPVEGDLGTAIERCEAVAALLDRWQDQFFAALPAEVDLQEEARYAAEHGIALEDLEQDWDDDVLENDDEDDEEVEGQLDLDVLELDEHVFLPHTADPATALLDETFVGELELALQLLPMRTRLEALIGASGLVATWTDLLGDHEKLLGHLVLVHGHTPAPDTHEALADLHAAIHQGMP